LQLSAARVKLNFVCDRRKNRHFHCGAGPTAISLLGPPASCRPLLTLRGPKKEPAGSRRSQDRVTDYVSANRS
jgi:hypothetical protein